MRYIAVLTSLILSSLITAIILPLLIEKMRKGGMMGRDVNKRNKPMVAELGGIAALFGFSLGLSLVVGIEKMRGESYETPILACIGVFFIAAMIGLIDDISVLSQKFKSVMVAFASLPLLLWHGQAMSGALIISVPFRYTIDFTPYYYFFWFVLVPIGITGVANAINMSAGYNGLESGQTAVISFFLMAILFFKDPELRNEQTGPTMLIFSSLFGCAIALFLFNMYPAKIFVGNIGTIGMGAVIGAGVVMGSLAVYGIICIIPTFYEAGATIYYRWKGISRKVACRNPRFLKNKKLMPPRGAEHYTLAYFILSKKPMTEKNLTYTILSLYVVCGLIAFTLSIL